MFAKVSLKIDAFVKIAPYKGRHMMEQLHSGFFGASYDAVASAVPFGRFPNLGFATITLVRLSTVTERNLGVYRKIGSETII